MSLHNTVRYLIDNFEILSGPNHEKYDGTQYHMFFDPTSFDQVLLVTEQSEYGNDSIVFAITEFGIYVREDDAVEPKHNFYHILVQSRGDFGLTIYDLADCHYMIKNFPKSWDI